MSGHRLPFLIPFLVAGTLHAAASLNTHTIPGQKPQAEFSDSIATDLGEMTVTADKVIMKDNTITLFPTRRDKRFASGGVDVIRNMNIPEISVDPVTKELKTSGGEGIAMFVDYIPASGEQMGDGVRQDE